MPTWIIATQWASRLVLLILFGLSIWSGAIMIDRRRTLGAMRDAKRAPQDLERARKLIEKKSWDELRVWTQENLTTPGLLLIAGTLDAAINTQSPSAEKVERAVRSYLTTERIRMEEGLTPLATLGSNAPFIGLFGTVLGIIQAFGALAAQSSNSTSVMTGISEALVATAVGLFVAIPAVLAYNIFSRQMRVIFGECDSLRDYYLSRQSEEVENRHGR